MSVLHGFQNSQSISKSRRPDKALFPGDATEGDDMDEAKLCLERKARRKIKEAET
ncbi:MAG: hypothetical protein ABSC03_13310 [Verrucomicrobiota bacterium]